MLLVNTENTITHSDIFVYVFSVAKHVAYDVNVSSNVRILSESCFIEIMFRFNSIWYPSNLGGVPYYVNL